MKTGQFVKGIFNGSTEAYQTKDAGKLLSIEEFDKLYNRQKKGVYLYINKEERVLAKSTVRETSDGERTGLINHTVIVKFDPSIDKDGLTYRMTVGDINEDLAAKTTVLNSPFPTLKQPLDEVTA